MICNNCGNKISNDSNFCNKCGHNITDENSELKKDVAENSTSNNNFTELESVYNQSVEQQNYENQNSEQPVKTNNNNVMNALIIVGAIIAISGIIFVIILVLYLNDLTYKKSNVNTISDTNITSDIIIEDASNDEIKLTKTYTNKEKNLSFKYPESWKVVDASQEGYSVIVALTASTDENSLKNMHIANVDTSTYTNYLNNKGKVPELYAMDGSEVKEVASTKIDGVDAVKVISNAADNTTGIQYFYNFNNAGYVITLYSSTDDFDEYKPTFDSIMESYKITYTTEDITQNQTLEDDGLSEAEALAEVQKFINTYPVLELEITGSVEDEPQLSSTEVYSVEVVAHDGSHWSLLVNKITGKVFIISDDSNIIEGEALYKKLYDELFVSNQNENVILFNGKKIADYIGTSISSINSDFGPVYDDTDIEGLFNTPTRQINYEGIGFIYNTELIIDQIVGNPEMFTYNGVTLDKNIDELTKILGEPIIDFKVYSDMYEADVYCIEYPMHDYAIRFTFKSEDSDACLITFY